MNKLDDSIHFFYAAAENNIVWRHTGFMDVEYYYAEERLYALRVMIAGVFLYGFILAGSPIEAAQKFFKITQNKE